MTRDEATQALKAVMRRTKRWAPENAEKVLADVRDLVAEPAPRQAKAGHNRMAKAGTDRRE